MATADANGAVDAATATPDTPTSTTAPSGVLALLNDIGEVPTLAAELVKAVETGASAKVLSSYVGESVALVGIIVGAFDQPLGLQISAVPQAVVLGVSAVLALGMAGYRLFFHHKVAKAAVEGAVNAHAMAVRYRIESRHP